MRGRPVFWSVAVLLMAVLAFHGSWCHRRYRANRILGQVERMTARVADSPATAGPWMRTNVRLLHKAAALDPGEVGIPLALGSQYLLLGRSQAAIAAYRDALALEPRAEIYLNLGRALQLAGRDEEAQENFRVAVRLDASLRREVPAGVFPRRDTNREPRDSSRLPSSRDRGPGSASREP